jgi:hypothetical protein
MIGVGLSITSLAVRQNPGNPLARLDAPLLRDPSDLSTLFQDAAGTIPVTSPGDTVMRQNNKGNLGGHFLATGALTYQTDGSHHWLETDGSGGTLEFSRTIPFSSEVFEVVAFRMLSFSHSFPSIVSNRGVFSNNTSHRQPLVYASHSSPTRISASIGGPSVGVNLAATLLNTDVVFSVSGSPAALRANANGQTASAAGVELSDGSSFSYRLYGPNPAHVRDYGGLHLNRVPNDAEVTTIRSYYASKSGGSN